MAEQFAYERENMKLGLGFENLEQQMAERFANETKCLKKRMVVPWDIWGMQPMPAKTAKKAENHNK